METIRTCNDSNLLSYKNSHKNDSRIKFQEEGHIYWIDDDSTNLISCTTYIHKFFEDFNTDKIIKNIISGFKWKNDPTYKYYKMTYEEIKKLWDDNGKNASKLGTELHAKIEIFYNDLEVEYTDESTDFLQFLDFYENHQDLEIYRTEWMIFAEDEKITGSVDALFLNEDGTLTIGDWKRSKKIDFESFGGKTGKEPFEYIEDSNYNHYCLQLNLYKGIIEKYYGFKVKDMFLGVFHPENKDGKYLKINIPIMEKETELLFEYRQKQCHKF